MIVGRAITLEREPSKKKQKCDNFIISNKEKSNIAIAILEKGWLDGTIILLYFGGRWHSVRAQTWTGLEIRVSYDCFIENKVDIDR